MLVVAAVLCAVIFSAAANILPLSVSGFCAIFAMVFLKIITPQEAIKSVEPSTLLIISSSAGVGKAIQHTGLGEWLGERCVVIGQVMVLVSPQWSSTQASGPCGVHWCACPGTHKPGWEEPNGERTTNNNH